MTVDSYYAQIAVVSKQGLKQYSRQYYRKFLTPMSTRSRSMPYMEDRHQLAVAIRCIYADEYVSPLNQQNSDKPEDMLKIPTQTQGKQSSANKHVRGYNIHNLGNGCPV